MNSDFIFALFLGSLLYLNFHYCFALRNVHLFIIPTAVQRGEDAILKCFYDLEKDKLYSVKWYRGMFEIFRYTPSEWPTMKHFKLPGLRVKGEDSNSTQMVLAKVSNNSAGNYSCEVTADQPSFFTQVDTATLRVIDLPKNHPHIVGLKNRYHLNETLKAECICEGSYPAANLTWFINGIIVVNETFIKLLRPKSYMHNTSAGLVTASSLIKFKIREDYFFRRKMKLRCSASIYRVYHKSSEKSVELIIRKKNHHLIQGMTTNRPNNNKPFVRSADVGLAVIHIQSEAISVKINKVIIIIISIIMIIVNR